MFKHTSAFLRRNGGFLLSITFLVFTLVSTNSFGQDPSGWTGEALAAPAANAPALPEGKAALAPPVGSFLVSDGPSFTEDIPTQTCLESCANLFGGAADDYHCSTDGGSVNNLAWASSWGSGQHCKTSVFGGPDGVPIAEDFKQGDSTLCGGPDFCYISTYVGDWCGFDGAGDSENFCFLAEPLTKEIVSGNDRDENGEIDVVVEINQEGDDGGTMYDFTITWTGDEPVLILDTVPAEWDVNDPMAFGSGNTGFEFGDLTDWATDIPAGGSAAVVTSQDDSGDCEAAEMTYLPTEGDYFLTMKTNGPGSQTTATTEVLVTAGMEIGGYAAFDYGDYNPFNDNARVEILNSDGVVVATPWEAYGLDVPDYDDGDWTAWSWTADETGVYTVRYRVANDGDGVCDSRAHFDGQLVPDGLNCTIASANKKDNGKSATKVECYTDGNGAELFWATTRRHNNKKNTKWRPTSCGALYLNDGAAAYALDENGDPLVDENGELLPPIAESNSLCLAAVEDLNGDGLDYSGAGDEDADGSTDYDEACEIGTDPCNPDTDGDGVLDGVDECPLEGPADPTLGEVLDPNGCIRQSQCSDGIDNDNDGPIDYDADASCDSIDDDTEDTADCPCWNSNDLQNVTAANHRDDFSCGTQDTLQALIQDVAGSNPGAEGGFAADPGPWAGGPYCTTRDLPPFGTFITADEAANCMQQIFDRCTAIGYPQPAAPLAPEATLAAGGDAFGVK